MNKKRLAVLLSCLCALNLILPTQVLFAKEAKQVSTLTLNQVFRTTSGQIDVEDDQTTGGQIDVEDDQTTSSAIDVTELEVLIEKAEKISNEAPIGTTTGCYDILDKMKFDLSIAEAKEALDTVQIQEEVQIAIIKLNEAIQRFENSKIVNQEELDLSRLQALITEAEKLLRDTPIGSEMGSCKESDKLKLSIAVMEAQRIMEVAKNQQAIDEAANSLSISIQVFKNALVPPAEGDINASGTIDVADLALVAYYYGQAADSEGWEQAKKVDLNQDGQINILDLTVVANKMLDK